MKALKEEHAKLFILDIKTEHTKLGDGIEYIHGDITDYPSLKKNVEKFEVTGVIHLAAKALVPDANRSPLSTFHTNIIGTANILEACRTTETIEKIVVASSDKAYGIHEKLPYSEDFRLNACYPYDVSKMCADRITHCYFKTYGLPVAITRLSNIYGGGDYNWSRIIPSTIRSVLLGENPIIRSDGSSLRDYLYIDDAVSAYMTLYEKLEEVRGEAFNFGTNSPISVLELVKKILRASKKTELKPIILGEARGEIDEQFLSSAKAKKKLGWEAETNLQDGLEKSYRWYKDHMGQWA